MGTNYYVRRNRCGHCNRGEDDLHVGKSSMGWTFIFQSHPGEGITSFADWIDVIKKEGGIVFDEYGESMSLEKFVELVESKQSGRDDRDGYKDSDGYSFLEVYFT